MMRPHVLQAFLETPWAILPSKLAVLQDVVTRHALGEKLNQDEIQQHIQAGSGIPTQKSAGKVAVLPVFGTIIPRADFLSESSGATSAETVSAEFTKLLQNTEVSAIVLDVNSPGGQVGGVAELSQQIFEARGIKPVVAVANYLMASAAYWIGSAASELVVSPSAQVGSIGVFAAHVDMSAALQRDGMQVSLISQGKYKTEGNPYQPLTEEARAAIQASVDSIYAAFVADVARNRGVNVADVQNGYGEGRVVGANDAVAMGMADRVETISQTVVRLLHTNIFNPSAVGPSSQRAEFEREAQSLRDEVDLYLLKE